MKPADNVTEEDIDRAVNDWWTARQQVLDLIFIDIAVRIAERQSATAVEVVKQCAE